MKKIVILSILVLFTVSLFSQAPILRDAYPDSLIKKRAYWVVGSETGLVLGSMSVLYGAWYKDYSNGKFHFKDDNAEWMYMDKFGHFTTSAYIGKYTYEFNRFAGMPEHKAILLSGGISVAYMLTIELLDGFSEGWGFSTGDLIANTSGTALFMGQQFLWHEQRFLMKMSYHSSEIHKTYLNNPDYTISYQNKPYAMDRLYKVRFGSTGAENFLKDYNGQTYWLSGNIASFLPEGTKFPKWLNVAFGISAEGMQGAKHDNAQVIADFDLHPRFQQYYFSLDVDFTRINTPYRGLNLLFHSLGYVKFPFPALEYNEYDGLKFHAMFF